MTELQQNRYDQLLRRLGGLIGAKSMVNDVLGELFPVLEVESLKAELQLPSGSRLAFGAVTQQILAGNVNIVQLFNPAESNVLVTLELVDVSSPATVLIEYALSTVPLVNFTANHALRDTREGILEQPVGQVRDVQQPGSLPRFAAFRVSANDTHTLQDKQGLFVLAPGTGISFSSATQGVATTITFFWRERVAEASELSFSNG